MVIFYIGVCPNVSNRGAVSERDNILAELPSGHKNGLGRGVGVNELLS